MDIGPRGSWADYSEIMEFVDPIHRGKQWTDSRHRFENDKYPERWLKPFGPIVQMVFVVDRLAFVGKKGILMMHTRLECTKSIQSGWEYLK